jgi:LPS sulfotransferase NodH
MTQTFDSFVVLAAMRTGSNFLETNLNAIDGITCHGEMFNPGFIGRWNEQEAFGLTIAQRNADPMRFLARMRAASAGLSGFRLFHDHDARVFPAVLLDRRCAKVVLTRNPVDSYVSWKIAQETGQWKLTNVKRARSAQATFDVGEFIRYMDTQQGWQLTILNGLQASGQAAFWIDYEDLQDLSVLNGLAAWLGVRGRLDALDPTLKRQNPEDFAEKVANFAEMEAALARLDRFNLSRTPNFEPRRQAGIPGYQAAGRLVHMPVRGGPEARVAAWMALHGPVEGDFSQKSLRQWMRARPGFRSFSVLRHPLLRAHAALFGAVLPGDTPELRQGFERTMQLDLPSPRRVDALAASDRRALLLAWLRFAKLMLGGQTGLKVHALVATQAAVLQGFAGVQAPDHVLREDRLAEGLQFLAAETGMPQRPLPPEPGGDAAALTAVLSDEISEAARDAYQRDMVGFGFAAWAG